MKAAEAGRLARQDLVGRPLRIPPLGDLEQAQLYSCLDIIRDRMGDAVSEQTAVDAILASNFDSEKALDQLLSGALPAPKTKPIVKETAAAPPTFQGMLVESRMVKIAKTNFNQFYIFHVCCHLPR